VHKERPFYNDLVSFMISGPVVVQVLEGENAVLKNREIMGATNPDEAKPGTIRKEFAESLEANSVHGSDSIDNAKIEVSFFFNDEEIVFLENILQYKMDVLNESDILIIAQIMRNILDDFSYEFGYINNEDVYDRVFSNFCIGK